MTVTILALLDETTTLLIKAWNENNVNKVIIFYLEDAVLFDDDAGQIVSGKNGSNITFS
jgi:ketosteroid isomerase-like protein